MEAALERLAKRDKILAEQNKDLMKRNDLLTQEFDTWRRSSIDWKEREMSPVTRSSIKRTELPLENNRKVLGNFPNIFFYKSYAG